MKRFYCIILFYLFIGILPANAVTYNFIDGLEDVPLMSGLTQHIDDTVSFGNEEARFIEVYLTSAKVGFKMVEKFYTESLPQLGWTYQGKEGNSLLFYREGEALNIHKESTKPLKIRITVKNRI